MNKIKNYFIVMSGKITKSFVIGFFFVVGMVGGFISVKAVNTGDLLTADLRNNAIHRLVRIAPILNDTTPIIRMDVDGNNNPRIELTANDGFGKNPYIDFTAKTYPQVSVGPGGDRDDFDARIEYQSDTDNLNIISNTVKIFQKDGGSANLCLNGKCITNWPSGGWNGTYNGTRTKIIANDVMGLTTIGEDHGPNSHDADIEIYSNGGVDGFGVTRSREIHYNAPGGNYFDDGNVIVNRNLRLDGRLCFGTDCRSGFSKNYYDIPVGELAALHGLATNCHADMFPLISACNRWCRNRPESYVFGTIIECNSDDPGNELAACGCSK